jgi:hypothetical protein
MPDIPIPRKTVPNVQIYVSALPSRKLPSKLPKRVFRVIAPRLLVLLYTHCVIM